MSFDLQAFISVPSQELLNLTKMSDLLDIPAHYELTNVNKSMLKQEIKNVLAQFLVDNDFFILLLCLLFSLHRQVCKCENLRFKNKLNLKK